MNNVPGQMDLFEEYFEFTYVCPVCKMVWTSFNPFNENYICPACKREGRIE